MAFFLSRKLIILLFLIISSSLISTSFAGGRSKFLVNESVEHLGGAYEESALKGDEKDEIAVHERLLRMNTHDYGKYDPSPAFRRPRHKLIPN